MIVIAGTVVEGGNALVRVRVRPRAVVVDFDGLASSVAEV